MSHPSAHTRDIGKSDGLIAVSVGKLADSIEFEGIAMRVPRRQFLQLIGAALLLAAPRAAGAGDYPTRPVRIVVPYPAGIAPDIASRLIAQSLSEQFGQ